MNQKFIDALEDYLHFIRVERQLADNTLASYKRDLLDYIHHITDEQQLKSFDEVTRNHILLHLENLRTNGNTARTVSRHISSIRSFHQFLLREKISSTDPTVHLELPVIEQKLPKVLSIEDIELLIAAPNSNKPQGVRDVAMLELLYGSGMRISELIELDLEDLHITMGFVRVFGKWCIA